MIYQNIDELPLVKPMLAVKSKPFDHPDYLFEVKWDGYRCLAYLDRQSTKLISRNTKNITDAFPDLHDLHTYMSKVPAILDGEIIVMQEGKPSFDALQSRAKLVHKDKVLRAAQKLPAIYMAFDVIYCSGESIMQLPLYARREKLQTMVQVGHKILISEQIQEYGLSFYQACVAKGLEGSVAKKIDSKYQPGTRSALWKKIRHTREADLVICGYRAGKGRRTLGSLVLAAWNGQEFIYQGMVGSGINQDEEVWLKKQLDTKKIDKPPLETVGIPGPIVWVLPLIVCQVEYLTLTREGILRHPVYKGLRMDKAPEECVLAEMQNKNYLNTHK